MTVTLHLKPEVEAGLAAQAQASGMAFDEYLLTVVEGAALPARGTPLGRDGRAEAVRQMLEFGEKYRLSSGAPISRALLHEGHRY